MVDITGFTAHIFKSEKVFHRPVFPKILFQTFVTFFKTCIVDFLHFSNLRVQLAFVVTLLLFHTNRDLPTSEYNTHIWVFLEPGTRSTLYAVAILSMLLANDLCHITFTLNKY